MKDFYKGFSKDSYSNIKLIVKKLDDNNLLGIKKTWNLLLSG